MVTTIKRTYMTVTNDGRSSEKTLFDVRCLSTDLKPPNATNGSTLIEMDTGKKYMFDGESVDWVEIDSNLLIAAEGVYF